jgi:hypothetical protein
MPSSPFPLSEELDGPLDEVLVELEHPAVPGVGIVTSRLSGSRRSRSTVFLVGTILSLSPFMTSTGWWMPASSAYFIRPHR